MNENETVEVNVSPSSADGGSPATEEAAAAAVATAGAAVALAQETAAHAELQAAEEVAEVKEDIETWQTATSALASEIGTGLASLNERLSALASREEERHNALNNALERMEALEARTASLSIPPPPESAPGSPPNPDLSPSERAVEVVSQPAEPAREEEPPARRRPHRWI